MKKELHNYLYAECKKLINRHYDYLFRLNNDIIRKQRRCDETIKKKIHIPEYWQIDKGFNPFYVKQKRKLEIYTYSLEKSLKQCEYIPKTSIIHPIPKASGGDRILNIFQIPDSAISKMIYKALLNKNVNLYSAYSYAYRDDRNAHDAINRINIDWKSKDRIYIAEFDFSKFFDNIDHDYLWNILQNYGFLYTEIEECVLRSFLNSSYADKENYSNSKLHEKRVKGIPQGTSVSLFLANIVCWELDQELEKVGVRFARYADDTLIWSDSYEKVVKSYEVITTFSKMMGVPINLKKSEGITILSEKKDEELKSKKSVIYLGYEISLKLISISNKSLKNIKDKISYLIYSNLLQPLINGIYNQKRLTLIDWDYITALAQIRRYMYGGLTDQQLWDFKNGKISKLSFRGVMSYYPIVNNVEQLKKMDGWLIYTLKQTLIKRQLLWSKKNITLPGPTDDWISTIDNTKDWTNPESGRTYNLRIPSFLLINQAMDISLKRSGITSLTNPKTVYYSSRN